MFLKITFPQWNIVAYLECLFQCSFKVSKKLNSRYIFTLKNILLLVFFSHSVLSDSLRPRGLQHSRFPCPSPPPGVYSNSCPLSWVKLMSIELMMPLNHCVLCCPLLLLTSTRVFSIESTLCNRWPKYWSFSISPSNEYSLLISFRIDWFDLLAVQGILKSLLQFESSNSLVLSLHNGPTLTSVSDCWKNHSFDYMGPVDKVIYVLFNTLSRYVTVFLLRSKHF